MKMYLGDNIKYEVKKCDKEDVYIVYPITIIPAKTRMTKKELKKLIEILTKNVYFEIKEI